MLVLAAYELDGLLSDRGTAVCGRAPVCDRREESTSDTLDIDSRVLAETFVFYCDDGIVKVCVLDGAVRNVDPVDIFRARELGNDITFDVINERCL